MHANYTYAHICTRIHLRQVLTMYPRLVLNFLHSSHCSQTPNPPASAYQCWDCKYVCTTILSRNQKLDRKRERHILFDNIMKMIWCLTFLMTVKCLSFNYHLEEDTFQTCV